METPFPPDCAARFRIVRPLAAGGFGSVFLATQLSLSREAAVKVLHDSALAEPAQVERFLAEARMTASLNHPNVVRIYDHGAGTGVPWIAYELLTGETLATALVRRVRFELDDALGAAAQVAAALEAAHEVGIVHRDVKPENVMMDAGSHCKLMDFGIGKWAGGVQTAAGVILGTPGFIAPELIRGEGTGPSGDLYALGALFYVLITGRLPLEGADVAQVLMRQAQEDPPPPSFFVPGLPLRVDQLAQAALARDPARRPASARAFREALEELRGVNPAGATRTRELTRSAILRGGGTAAHTREPLTSPTRVVVRAAPGAATPLSLRVKRRLPAALLMAAVFGAIALAAYSRRTAPTVRVASPSSTSASPASQTPATPRALDAAARARLAELELEATAAQRENRLAAQLKAVERMLELDPVSRYALEQRPNLLDRLGRSQDAVEAFRAQNAAGAGDPASYTRLGSVLARLGRHEEAIEVYRRGIELDATDPHSRVGLGRALADTGRLPEAELELRAALALNRPGSSWGHHSLATVLMRRGRFAEAQQEDARAVKADPEEVDLHLVIAGDLVELGRRLQARAHLECLKTRAPKDPRYELTAGRLLAGDGKFTEALPHLRRAVELLPGDPDAVLMLAGVALHLGGDAEAVAILERRLAEAPGDRVAMGVLARAYARAGRAAEALALVNALMRDRADSGVLNARVEVLYRLGRTEELAKAARALIEHVRASTNAVELESVASLLAGVGLPGEAIEMLERAHKLAPRSRTITAALSGLLRHTGSVRRCLEVILEGGAAGSPVEEQLWMACDLIKKLPDRKEQERLLVRATVLAPGMTLPFRLLGEMCYADGRLAEARDWFLRLRKLDPGSSNVTRMLTLIEIEESSNRRMRPSVQPSAR